MHRIRISSALRDNARVAALTIAAPLALLPTAARAEVTISSGATTNMVCASGVCAPTAADAVLNVGDLETLLASGNVTVTTTGSGVQAQDIRLNAPLGWTTTATLAFDAYLSIAIDKPLDIQGESGLSLTTNDGGTGGTLSFGKNGYVAFANLSSNLAINGVSYTLVTTIAKLAREIDRNPGGSFALAKNYDARGDGTYSASPIFTVFFGTFEGLGNRICHVTIDDSAMGVNVGLFARLYSGGAIAHLRLTSVNVKGAADSTVGGIVGQNSGILVQNFVSGRIAVDTVGARYASTAGGIAGENVGAVSNSFATATTKGFFAGGLVGDNSGTIDDSYAIGGVTVWGTNGPAAGGLVGVNEDNAGIADSYSTGAVSSTSGGYVGGLVGFDRLPAGDIVNTYWDTTTSGITNLSQGAGNIRNDPGIKGLTTVQLQTGLPKGFSRKIWAENSNINGGLPYLLANPPPK